MEKDEFDRKKAAYRKALSDFKRTGRIQECFYHDRNQCKGDIKQSHSLQRNGRLSIIEGEVNGNQMIYTFTENEIDEHTSHATLKPIGKASASTFFGFCDYHDTVLFSEIENSPFDESDKHCFLHSYRSFAHSYHRKREEYKAYSTKSKFTEILPEAHLKQVLRSLEVGIKDGEIPKAALDKLIGAQEYDGLEYLIQVLPERFPIACSSQISPFYTYKGKPFNNHGDPDKPYSFVTLTVLPDFDQTIIIFSCFPQDKIAVEFLDELEALFPYPFQKAVSSLLINCAENTFFAPALWNALGIKGQRALCDELDRSAAFNYIPKEFDHSNINFFDSRLSAKRLGIV